MPYTLNGQPGNIAEEPNEQQGVVYVPYKQVVEGLGGTVTWDNTSKTAVGTIGKWAATFTLGSDTADVSGTTVQFPSPSFVDSGELYVPAEFFHAAYGYTVSATGTDVSIGV